MGNEKLSYDYFNTFMGSIVSPIAVKCSDLEKQRVGGYLARKMDSSLVDIVSPLNDSGWAGKVSYFEGMNCILSPDICSSHKWNGVNVGLKTKITVNPFSSNVNNESIYGKILVSTETFEPLEYVAGELVEFFESIERRSLEVLSSVGDFYDSKLEESMEIGSLYDFRIRSASACSGDVQRGRDFLKKLSGVVYMKEIKRDKFGNQLVDDVMLLNAVDSKDEEAWKLTRSRYSDSLVRIDSNDQRINVTHVAFIDAEKDKREILLQDPNFEISDFVREL